MRFLAPARTAVAAATFDHPVFSPLAPWRGLLDTAAVATSEDVVIGSGVRHSKLVLPGDLLAALPAAEVADVDGGAEREGVAEEGHEIRFLIRALP